MFYKLVDISARDRCFDRSLPLIQTKNKRQSIKNDTLIRSEQRKQRHFAFF